MLSAFEIGLFSVEGIYRREIGLGLFNRAKLFISGIIFDPFFYRLLMVGNSVGILRRSRHGRRISKSEADSYRSVNYDQWKAESRNTYDSCL